MSGETRPIILIGEEAPTCPDCGRRLAVSDRPIALDADGPIFAGICGVHGTWRIQDDTNDEEDGDGE